MKFVRFQTRKEPPLTGWLLDGEDASSIGLLEGSIFDSFRRMEADIPLELVYLLAPIIPSKIICIGRNYAAHAREHSVDVPDVPLLFLKPPHR